MMFRFQLLTYIFSAASVFGQGITFSDASQKQGLIFKHEHGGSGMKYYVETMGSGVCLLDYDNDGDLDIYFAQGASLPGFEGSKELINRLFQNNGGKWSDVTKKAGVGDPSYSIGSVSYTHLTLPTTHYV